MSGYRNAKNITPSIGDILFHIDENGNKRPAMVMVSRLIPSGINRNIIFKKDNSMDNIVLDNPENYDLFISINGFIPT